MTQVAPWLAAASVVVAVNPLRLIGRLPALSVVGLGVALVAAAYLAMGAVASSLLDAIAVSPPTLRVGAGLVLIAGALRDLVAGPPDPEPALEGMQAALVPVALPMLLRPHVGVLVVSVGASDGMAPLVLGVGAVVALSVGTAAISSETMAARIGHWLAHGAGVAAVALGVALAVDGVFSV